MSPVHVNEVFCCSPYAYMDPLSTNLTFMFSSLLKDALTEYTYDAELAGLGYDILNTLYGLSVSDLVVVSRCLGILCRCLIVATIIL